MLLDKRSDFHAVNIQKEKHKQTRKNLSVNRFSPGFHDCVGGCDGCINIDSPHNAGLDLAIEIMENVYQDVESDGVVVSRADVWAICGRASAEFGMEGMPGHQDYDSEAVDYFDAVNAFVSPFPAFKSGRVDCETAPYTSDVHEFPTGHYVHDEVMDYFAEQFGFDNNEVLKFNELSPSRYDL